MSIELNMNLYGIINKTNRGLMVEYSSHSYEVGL